MEYWQIKLILAIVGVAVSAGGGGVVVHKMYAEKLEAKTIESEDRLHRLQVAQSENSALREDQERLTANLTALQGKYDVLLKDYNKATRADGLTYDGPSDQRSWQEVEVSTGDQIRFKLSSASLYMRVSRVTHEGPIVRASGAIPRLVDPSFVSERDGSFAYLLRPERELHLQVSGKGSVEGYLSADLSDLEDVSMVCQSFDVKTQKATIKFQKCLHGR
jgi:hypothetical protein